MAKLEKRAKQNPKLEKRILSDGRISLYLNYYLGREEIPLLDDAGNPVLYESGPMKGKPKYKVTHHRKKKYLNYYLLAHPRKPADKEKNRQTLALAEKIRFEKEQQFKESQTGYRIMQNKDVNFYDYFQSYIDNYTKKDIRMMQIALKRFRDFMKDNMTYNIYEHRIKPNQLTKDIHVAHRQPPIRWVACLRVYGRLAMPCYSGQAAHFFIIDIPCRAAREKITQKFCLCHGLAQCRIYFAVETNKRYSLWNAFTVTRCLTTTASPRTRCSECLPLPHASRS